MPKNETIQDLGLDEYKYDFITFGSTICPRSSTLTTASILYVEPLSSSMCRSLEAMNPLNIR